jgi:hypothetical protein
MEAPEIPADREVTGEVFLGKAWLHIKSNMIMVTTAHPDEEHNCDQMGCSSLGEHVIAWAYPPARFPRWVSVKERLPEKEGMYLVILESDMKDRDYSLAYFDQGWVKERNWKLTHWLSNVLELPKEDRP